MAGPVQGRAPCTGRAFGATWTSGDTRVFCGPTKSSLASGRPSRAIGGAELCADDTLQAVRTRHLTYARPRLVGQREHTRLLVTNRRQPWLTSAGIEICMKRYLPNLNAWILQDSRRAHEAEVGRRLGEITK